MKTNADDNFKLAFLEEAREIIVDLEAALLALNENPGDSELVGRTFRALHTIKGSGAMFGFDTLAAFTHGIENAFDEVRNARLNVTPELINLSLAALDQIKTMLGEASGGLPASALVTEEIQAMVRRLTGKPEPRAAQPASGEPPPVVVSAAGVTHDWHIRFSPGAELMRNGGNPLMVLAELKQMGKLQVSASTAGIPPIGELDPLRCYVSWEMVLATPASRDAIRDAFLFVTEACDWSIQPAPDKATGTSPAEPNAPPGKRSGYGRRSYDRPDTASSIRVPAEKLDLFVDLVGELVTVQARLGEIATRAEDPDVMAVSEEVDRLTSALRESSMSIRMLTIRPTFERFRRRVHDLARDLHKEVELAIEGAETELDKTVIDQLNDPLMHLVRNSMDHGIELPERRVAAGKPRTATLRLSAKHSGGSVLISVSDDGNGIDAEAVRKRAVEKALVAADAQLSESQVFQLILAPGFSTARQVTDISGRGVGMDVVRRNVEALRGTIDIASLPGRSTSVTLRLPLTLAIIDGLLVRVGIAYFVLPLTMIVECIELTRQDVEKANGKDVCHVRGELIPYIRLREYFRMASERPDREQIMIVETEEGRYGFVVDQVIGTYQTVIKNLGRFYRHVQVASGATILGNGTVALILDPHRLVQEALRTGESSWRKRGQDAAPRKSGRTRSASGSSGAEENAGMVPVNA